MPQQNKPQANKPQKPEVSPVQIQNQAGPDLGTLQQQIAELRTYIDEQIRNHIHNGTNAYRVQLDTDLAGLFEVVSSVPTGIPLSLFDQIKIYRNGSTKRLYWYDQVAHDWSFATGT